MGRFWNDMVKLFTSWIIVDHTDDNSVYMNDWSSSNTTEEKSSSSEFDAFVNRSSTSSLGEGNFFCRLDSQTGGELELRKRQREDRVAVLEGLNAVAKSSQAAQAKEGEEEPDPKRHRADVTKSSADVIKSSHLRKAQNLAMKMATKASSLERELKSVKSELHLVQEENIRLREGRAYEDDLLRPQLEALLAEKWKLVQENASLIHEKEDLLQLVEYQQLSSPEEEYEERDISADEDDLLRLQLEEQLAEKWRLQQENIDLTRENGDLLQLVEYFDQFIPDDLES